MNMNTGEILISKYHVYIPKSIFLNVFLIALALEHFGAQAVVNFVIIPKTANPPLKSLTLDCSVSDNPISVLIYRKYPPSVKPEKIFNRNNDTVVRTTIHLKSEECTDIIGQYECTAVFLHRELQARTQNVQISECQYMLCDEKLNNSVTYANVGDNLKLEICVWEPVKNAAVDIYDVLDKPSLQFSINHIHNTTTQYTYVTATIKKILSSDFGAYKIKFRPDKHGSYNVVIYLEILEKGKPTLCDKTANDKVIKVTKETVNVTFCVLTKESIDQISLNGHLLFHKVLISSSKYDLFNTTKGSAIHFSLSFHEITKESHHNYTVQIVSKSNLTLDYRFSLLLTKESPALCDETRDYSEVTAVTNKATVEICVISGDNFSYIMINEIKIFDHGIVENSQYKLLNRTDENKIYFTIKLLNLTRNSPEKYYVKFFTAYNAQLAYQFNVKLNSLIEVSNDCFTTENASIISVTNNTVIVMICVKLEETISNAMVDGRNLNVSFLEYTITNITKGNNTQFVIEFRNIDNEAYRDVYMSVKNISGSVKEYIWYLLFPKETTKMSTVPDNYIAIVIPIIGLLLFFLIITMIVFLRFKSKSMKRRQRYGQAYDNVTYKSSENMLRPNPLPAFHGSSLTPGPSLGPPKGQEEDNLYSPQGTDHYVNDDGLIYVVMSDIETRKSTSSVKDNKHRVQYLEIDFTKTGKIKIAEAEPDTTTVAEPTTTADVQRRTLKDTEQVNET